MGAADRWTEGLGQWRIPKEILAAAPEPPWGFPPSLFTAESTVTGALHERAMDALAGGGTVLDVGCGGGRASVPLAPAATGVTGVDRTEAMLDSFVETATREGLAAIAVRGSWPEIAGSVPDADVVVCRNVVYDVSDIAPFVIALGAHARRRVIVELAATHPSVALGPLWRKFWSLDRPQGPTAADFAAVLGEIGILPKVETAHRVSAMAASAGAEQVAFVRRRLCLPSSMDAEVQVALDRLPGRGLTDTVVMTWDP